MEKLINQTIFKCSYCSRISKSAAGILRHELSCKKEPTQSVVVEKALLWARRQKGNVLSNKNVYCFIAGFRAADTPSYSSTKTEARKLRYEINILIRNY